MQLKVIKCRKCKQRHKLTEIVMLGEKYRISLKHEQKTWTNISKSFQQGIKKECDSGLLPGTVL